MPGSGRDRRTEVTCPSCGGPTRDARCQRRPRWRCLRASCPFVYGWQLDFPDGLPITGSHLTRPAPDAGEHPAMVAVPYSRDGVPRRELAVIWPPHAAASTSQEAPA